MESWDLLGVEVAPQAPRVIASNRAARTILIRLATGEHLGDHEVHERSWLLVLTGAIEVRSGDQDQGGGPGFMVEIAPGERHEVRARDDSRLLLLLAPWPGPGHPALVLDEEGYLEGD